jgi:FAD/FMN-containing dehydrogenase
MGEPSTTANSHYRNALGPAGSRFVLEADAPTLLELQTVSLDLKIYTTSHPKFQTLNTYFHLDLTPHPLAIIRPTIPLQVSQIIRFATSSNIPFTVRAGGHDSWGRSAVTGALTIDLRELDSITLADDKKSVRIGGGTISENLTKFLAPHGLVAVQGGCSSVGYTNWAACGGYSSLNGSL